MEKVNCAFCGTAFPESDEKCPICGFPRKIDGKAVEDDTLTENAFDFLDEEDPARKKNKHIFDYDEVNSNDEEDDEDEEEDDEDEYDDDEYDDDEDEDEDDEPRSNTFLIVILVIIIALLLLATGFVFFRYFLPNMAEETEPSTTEAIVSSTDESTEPTVPCTMIALTSEAAMLNQAGQPWLLHVTVTPENTTDELVFTSENEAVATVSEDGKVTAVGEGETIIRITCGAQVIQCPVVVDYDMAIEETSGDDAVPTMGVEADEPSTPESTPEDTQPVDVTEETQAEETTAAEESAPAETVLKLKETDISLSKIRGITYELTLECDISADQIEWITMNSDVLLVKDGVITVMGPGTTKVVAKYNGQSVECIVRCVF